MRKVKLQKIIKLLVKWLGIIIAMTLFVLATNILGQWMQDKIWLLFVLDGVFCLFLWLFLDLLLVATKEGVGRYIRLPQKKAITILMYVCIMVILFFVIVVATLGLFEVLLARLNVILLPMMALIVVYKSFMRHKII